VARAHTAEEAVALLAGGAQADLLFSDIVMPGRLSGVDLAHEARRLRPGLPVVLMTGYSEDVARAAGLQVLAKPFRIKDIIRILEEALAARSAPSGRG
jgi:CheY-like chemotaxis protein